VDAAALQGLPGEIVGTLGPHTEADPHAILVQLLVAFGNMAGRGPHFRVEADRHGTNLFVVLVGETAKGRKGTSWGHVQRLFESVDSNWASHRIQSGLSSGEGLIWAVRDARYETRRGKPTEAGGELVDSGVDDKRLLILEAEFVSPLCVMRREGNTLSALLRQAWDSGELRTLTKNAQAVASGAHISLVGHITRDELLRHLNETETANGFANRHLWVCVRRCRVLPEGGSIASVDLTGLEFKLAEAVRFAREAGELTRDSEARELWRAVYPALSEGRAGLYGAITSRAEAQTMRLALNYALLDRSDRIRRVHLEAALAVWAYCDDSCRYVFGNALGDPVADQVLSALADSPVGLTRTQIRDLFGRHERSADVTRALHALSRRGLARCCMEESGGRPVERWFNAAGATKATYATEGRTHA
jgi:hypothetical protein